MRTPYINFTLNRTRVGINRYRCANFQGRLDTECATWIAPGEIERVSWSKFNDKMHTSWEI